MDRSQAEQLAAALPGLPPADAFRSGLGLLNADFPELLLPPAARLAQSHPADDRMAQLEGLAARAAGNGPAAWRAFARAAALAPGDALIAHSHARTALEAGKPASELFEIARRRAPADGSVLQGLAAALFAEGRARDAQAMLRDVLVANPLWLDGHRTYSQIAGQAGTDPMAQIDAALAQLPRQTELHRLRISTLLEARRHDATAAAVMAAERAIGSRDWLTVLAAHAASERGDMDDAVALFEKAPEPAEAGGVGLLARHLLKSGQPDKASALLDRWPAESDPTNTLWPYRALAWRLLGDARAEWLEQTDGLVGIYDLADRIDDLGGLADRLRALHISQEAPLDQSVRNGTQTDGNLLLRDDPAIQSLRSVLIGAVEDYVASLPRALPGHPTLVPTRTPVRIAGSWSVRLRDAGFHSDHVHSQGWLSSALYIALPHDSPRDASSRDPHAGWLSIGESREVAPGLAPRRLIEPKPGRLVLFPSTMWHGTRAFPAGERLTVAFDIARPKQDPITA